MDAVTVKATIQRWLSVASMIVKFTPNQIDDKVISTLQVLAENDALIEILTNVLNMIHLKTGTKITEDDLLALVKAAVNK